MNLILKHMVEWWGLGNCHTNHVPFVVDRWINDDTDIFYHETTPNDPIASGADAGERGTKKELLCEQMKKFNSWQTITISAIKLSTHPRRLFGTSWMRNTYKKQYTWKNNEKNEWKNTWIFELARTIQIFYAPRTVGTSFCGYDSSVCFHFLCIVNTTLLAFWEIGARKRGGDTAVRAVILYSRLKHRKLEI